MSEPTDDAPVVADEETGGHILEDAIEKLVDSDQVADYVDGKGSETEADVPAGPAEGEDQEKRS